MRREQRKLTFKAQTVRVLSAPQLETVVGGTLRAMKRLGTAPIACKNDPPTTAPMCGGGGGNDPPTTAPNCGGGGCGGGGGATTAIFCG